MNASSVDLLAGQSRAACGGGGKVCGSPPANVRAQNGSLVLKRGRLLVGPLHTHLRKFPVRGEIFCEWKSGRVGAWWSLFALQYRCLQNHAMPITSRGSLKEVEVSHATQAFMGLALSQAPAERGAQPVLVESSSGRGSVVPNQQHKPAMGADGFEGEGSGWSRYFCALLAFVGTLYITQSQLLVYIPRWSLDLQTPVLLQCLFAEVSSSLCLWSFLPVYPLDVQRPTTAETKLSRSYLCKDISIWKYCRGMF